jgi:hypothetical protein
MVHTLCIPVSLSRTTPSSYLTSEIRKFFSRDQAPIIVSLDRKVLEGIRNECISKIHLADIREAFAIFNHKYCDVLFLGGVDTRQILDNADYEPKTLWSFTCEEYEEFKSIDQNCFLKALELFEKPNRPV